jgi:acetyltransferase-like isoleucine patch superfamily enzyme
MMEVIFKNPITIWLRWLIKLMVYRLRYRGKHLLIEYLAEINQCTFSEYNTIYKYARLRDASLGKCSYVGRDSQVYHAKVGSFSCIGPGVLIGLGEHPTSEFVSSHPIFYSTRGQSNPIIVETDLFEEMPETIIGNDVWIGARAILRTGVKIGDGAIIAAGAVVVKDVEPFSIVGGVPAKHIRFRFTQEQIEKVQASQWWNKDLEWIKGHHHEFLSIDRFKGI